MASGQLYVVYYLDLPLGLLTKLLGCLMPVMVLDATLPAIARAMGHFRRLDESLEKEKSAETSVDQDRSPTMNEDYQEEYTVSDHAFSPIQLPGDK